MGMNGFRESLLTRVLCVVKPDEFLPILTYSGAGTGKRDITQAVFGLKMPKQDQVSMQIGRLAVWSNNLLLELVGDGFATCQHASAFLWWAKDQHFGAGGRYDAGRRQPSSGGPTACADSCSAWHSASPSAGATTGRS